MATASVNVPPMSTPMWYPNIVPPVRSDLGEGGYPAVGSTSMAIDEARRAAGRFAAGVGGVRPFGGGHINETFLVGTPAGDLVLQRINRSVFPDPEAVTANIVAVHDHLGGACMPRPLPTL